MVAVNARVQLHHQAVFHAHARHFEQHIGREAGCVSRGGLAMQGALENRFGICRIERRAIRAERAGIGGCGAQGAEESAALLEGGDKGRIIC